MAVAGSIEVVASLSAAVASWEAMINSSGGLGIATLIHRRRRNSADVAPAEAPAAVS